MRSFRPFNTMYDIATVAYVASPDFVMAHQSAFEGRVRSVHIPVERAIDIDTLIDFKIAEILYANVIDSS